MIKEVKSWEKIAPPPEVGDSRCFTGTAGSWRFVLVDFEIESQGFPKGSRGYDGTAVSGTMVIRLPRDIAREGFERALSIFVDSRNQLS